MSVTPTDAEIILEAIESRLLDVHTALPGRIESYDNVTQTADIQLEIQRMIVDDSGQYVTEDLPKLPNVRIAFPRSSNFFISFPLDKDDKVLVLFSESSIDQYRSKGKNTTPADGRRFTLTGAIAFPVDITNDAELTDSHASHMAMGMRGGQKAFTKSSGTVEITDDTDGDADDFVAMAGKVLAELQGIATAYNGHVHPYAAPGPVTGPPGPAPTGTPPTIITPSSVPSSNLKADD